MSGRAVCGLTLATMLMWTGTSIAQVLEPPERNAVLVPTPPPDRLQQSFSARLNLLGGWRNNPTRTQLVAPINTNTYSGFGDASLRYGLRTRARGLDVGANGYAVSSNLRKFQPYYGGGTNIGGFMSAGRTTTLRASQSIGYAPLFVLNLFGPLQSTGLYSPGTNPTNAAAAHATWNLTTNASVGQQLSRGTALNAGYSFNRRVDPVFKQINIHSQTETISVSHTTTRTMGIDGSAHRVDGQFIDVNGQRKHYAYEGFDGGFNYRHGISATRSLLLTGGFGATHVNTLNRATGQPNRYWTTSAYATTRVDVGRSWNVGAEYRRSVSTVAGLNYQPLTAVGQSVQVNTGGGLSKRVQFVGSAGYSKSGHSGAIVGQSRYDVLTATVQTHILLARAWSAIVSADHYDAKLNNAGAVYLGVSPRIQREAFRVGVTWVIPSPQNAGRGRRRR